MMQNPVPANRVIPERLQGWLSAAVDAEASDLHLITSSPPVIRVHGTLRELPGPALESEELERLLSALCPPEALARLEEQKNVDFSFSVRSGERDCRFRANLFYAGRSMGACFRFVQSAIPNFQWAGFPQPLADRITGLADGLVIVTGVTGCGKTTTLAMLLNKLHLAGGRRIITIEDPVEYLYPQSPNSVLTQREVGIDVLSFADGLKYGLRQDPDVILVGEIRDRETAQMALSAAETGHLVLTTLHTRDTKGAITRYADLFPQEVQGDIRSQLSLALRAIVSQRLLPDIDPGAKRHLALEVLWNTYPIANGIRLGKLESIDNYLITHRDEGMLSFDESVKQLLRAGKITQETAVRNVREPAVLRAGG